MYRDTSHLLFNTFQWYDFSQNVTEQARSDASELTKTQFESNSKEQIVEHIASKYELQPLNLKLDEKEQDIIETAIDVTGNFAYVQAFDNRHIETPAYKIIVSVPYSGSETLFKVTPATHSLHNFSADTLGGKLSFSKEFPQSSATAESIEQAVSNELQIYVTEIDYINKDLTGFNANLRTAIEESVDARYEQINKLDSIKSALKIPIQKSTSPSSINRVNIAIKKIAPLSTQKDDPGAYISDGDYTHIIDSMRSAGASMETTRASEFQDEEALRDVMLVVLSGSIVGGIAGGELFHKKGKTDISIPFENKATFVAECKLWKGAKYVKDGVDQLLGYTTWRDAKTALVIFNKDNANFSAIQGQIEGIFTSHENYVRSINQRDGEWRFVLTKPDDLGRHIEVHVLLFDLYSKGPQVIKSKQRNVV